MEPFVDIVIDTLMTAILCEGNIKPRSEEASRLMELSICCRIFAKFLSLSGARNITNGASNWLSGGL